MSEFDVVQDYVAAAQRTTKVDDLKTCTEDAVKELGFDYFAILHHLDLQYPADGMVRFGNYPSGFKAVVEEQRYFVDDPVLLASQKISSGFLWSEVSKLIRLSQRQHDIIALGAKEGMGDGYTVPLHIPGEYAGSSSFGVRYGKSIRLQSLPMVHYLGSYAFEAARRIASMRAKRNANERANSLKLTDRQLDCVVLVGQGATAKDAAKALGLKPDTVQKHIDDAKGRLGVRTTMELVVRSLFDGRVTFSDLLKHKDF